jgi:hypothetical protein
MFNMSPEQVNLYRAWVGGVEISHLIETTCTCNVNGIYLLLKYYVGLLKFILFYIQNGEHILREKLYQTY